MSNINTIESFPNEVWRDIPNYEGLYQISDKGRVKSLSRFKNGKNQSLVPISEKILKLQFRKCGSRGYYQKVRVTLNKNGIQKKFFVHILVAKTFIDNYNDLLDVHHIDFDSTNNCVENLVLLSKEEHRQLHSKSPQSKFNKGKWQIGSKNPMYGIKGKDNPSSKPICAFNKDFYKEYVSLRECAKDLGFPSTPQISNALKKGKSAHGYNFKYLS